MSQRKVGVILSYINLAIGLLINVFLTPILINYFGDLDYSIYKVMQSFAGPLTMFNLGISTVVTRCISKIDKLGINAEKEKKNTIAISMIVSVIMSVLVIIVGIFMCFLIPNIYGNTYSAEYVLLAQKIFIIFMLSAVVHMLTDSFSGCILGHEKYVVSAAIPIVKNVIRVVLTLLFLSLGLGVLYVAIVDLIYAIVIFIFSCLYSLIKLKEIPKLIYWDKKQVIEILLFGLALLLQAIVTQVNNNVDTLILGAFVEEKRIITMYSSALVIFAFYNSLISEITKFFLPKATKLVSSNASGKELTDFIIYPGRWQAVIAVGCIAGFALFGENFISIWIGDNYKDAYLVALILMLPVTIPLVENAAISILDATLKRLFRSVVLIVMAVVNVIISIFLVQLIGFWGAVLGTVLSLLIGHGLLMNMYYAKKFKIEIFRMFKEIFKGILPAGVLSIIVSIPLLFLGNSLFFFVIKCIVFIIIYLLFLMLFGFNKTEKTFVFQFASKSSAFLKNKKQ